MKKTLFSAFLVFASALSAAPVFEETFEDPGKVSLLDIRVEEDTSGPGKFCGHLDYPPDADSQVRLAQSSGVIPVEPGEWYRLSVRTRNDVKLGEVKFGLIESRSAEKRVSQYSDYHWKAVSLNITDWHTSTLEFKTASNTRGVMIYLRSENNFSGSSWWDDIRLEKFEKQLPPLEIMPFRAAGSFTDIPTKSAYAVTNGKRGVVTRNDTDYLWEILDLAREEINVTYRDLPPGSEIRASVVRGDAVCFREDREISGSGHALFNIGLDRLREGIYVFRAELFENGKRITCQEKELWRIDSRKCATPEHEDIRTVSCGPGRQRLVNGKIFNHIYAAASPTWGLFSHHKKFCKPDAGTYIRTVREQFGQDTFVVWSWRGPQWDDKRGEFLRKAVADCREYLDFLRDHNCYGKALILITPHKPEKPDLEEVRQFVREMKDHPALLEWYLDEPEFRYTPEEMTQLSQTVRNEDPDHPVYVNLCDPSKFHLYAPSSDIASYDIYPFPGAGLIESQKRTQALLKAFPSAPFDSYLQMFNFKTMDMPTFDQLRASFLLDRINGSHSLISLSWGSTHQSFQTDPELQSYYRAIVSMFRRLEPVLRNPAAEPLPLESSHEFVAHKMFQEGDTPVLLLVNLSNDTPTDVSFSHAATEAEDFFDPAWTYKPEDGKYRFRLEPNQSLVLRLKRSEMKEER